MSPDAAHRCPAALRRECLFIGAAACLGTALAGRALTVFLRLTPDYPFHAAAVVAGGMTIASARIGRTHPWTRVGPANVVTAVRLTLTGLLAGLCLQDVTGRVATIAAVIGLVAVSLDGLDGYLSRRSGLVSAFGARFDMEVDALLILVLAGLLHRTGTVGLWVLTSGGLRYAFVAAAWAWPWLGRALPYSRRRQTVCVVQISALLIALSPAGVPPAGSILAALSLAALAWSFAIDIAWLWTYRRTPSDA